MTSKNTDAETGNESPPIGFHDGLFVGSVFVALTTAVAAYLQWPSAWAAGVAMIVLWMLAATLGDDQARGPM